MKATFAIALICGLTNAIHVEQQETDNYLPTNSGQLTRGGYARVIPDRFSADSDDIFMRSMYNNYAVEGQNKDKSPNGVFTLTESGARAAASEVLATHKKLSGEALGAYLDTYWSKAWGHFDVNRTGAIPILYAPGLMRFLLSDQYISFQ